MGEDSTEFRRLQALGRRDSAAGEWQPRDQPQSVTIAPPPHDTSARSGRLLDYQPLATQSPTRQVWRASLDAIEDTLGFTLLAGLFALFIGMLIDTSSGALTFSVCLPATVLLFGLSRIILDIRRRLIDRPRGRL